MKIPTIKGNDTVAQGKDTAAILPLTQLRFSPPSIRSAENSFIWPMGVEGFTRSGSATLGIHKYLGADHVSIQVAHLDEAHIEMNGTFPGLTSKNNMAELMAVITADGPKSLLLPGIFSRIQTVYCENYNFTHAADERTHSIDYTISFVRTTVGNQIDSGDRFLAALGVNVGADTLVGSPRSTSAVTLAQSDRIFVVADGARTLREIASVVYGDQSQWKELVALNTSVIEIYNPGIELGVYQLPTVRLPIGTKIIY